MTGVQTCALPISAVAATEGLHFDYSRQTVSPNTRNAHRMIWYARKDGKQAEIKEALMKAYFEDGVDLSKKENLIAIAGAAGLSMEKVRVMLNSSEGLLEIEAAEEMSHRRGIKGVPFYVINNTYGVSGAQPSEVFAQTIKEIAGKA